MFNGDRKCDILIQLNIIYKETKWKADTYNNIDKPQNNPYKKTET